MPEWIKTSLILSGDRNDLLIASQKIAGKNGEIDFESIKPMPQTLAIRSSASSDDAAAIVIYEQLIAGTINESTAERLYDATANIKDYVNIDKTYRDACKMFGNGVKSANFAYLFDYQTAPKSLEDARFLGNTMLQNIQKFGVKDWLEWRIKNWGTKWNARNITADIGDYTIEYTFEVYGNMPAPIYRELERKFPHLQISAESDGNDSNPRKVYSERKIVEEQKNGIGEVYISQDAPGPYHFKRNRGRSKSVKPSKTVQGYVDYDAGIAECSRESLKALAEPRLRIMKEKGETE